VRLPTPACSQLRTHLADSHRSPSPCPAFLLSCLDVRRAAPASLAAPGEVEAVESAALEACVALVLKLSEVRFMPLFMTALEWARARPEQAARPHTFFRLVCSLAAALRSVFVPFFRLLLPDAIAHLEQQDGAAPNSKKARRAAAAAAGADPLASWLLRTQVVRALGLCFLHDSAGFLDETRFTMLLVPLLQQVEVPVPPGAADAAVAEADAALVDCLTQMAQTVGQDTLWRPLNRGVLMATRSQTVRPRRLGLAIVTALAERLAEEYLVLLPETLPFLAELVEDQDERVEAAARGLLATLSQIAEEDVADLLGS